MAVATSVRPRAALRWQSFEAWVGTRSSALAVFVLSLAVFGIQSLVLPAFPGRDMSRYIQTFVQLPYPDIILPSVMNTRGPLAALGVGGPLELGGVAAEIWLALLYAASILAWAAVALTFGKRAAILATGLLLVYPGYGILFHGLASDSLFAAAFAGWCLLLTRAMIRPSVIAFLLAGLGMGALVLVRPSNQVLIVFSLLPLLVRGSWSDRVRWIASFFVASVVITQGWKAIAMWRYGDGVELEPSTAVLAVSGLLLLVFLVPTRWHRRFALLAIPVVAGLLVVASASGKGPIASLRTVAQVPGGNPFAFRVFEIDPIVSPENGPASRQLARVVQRDLLTKEPYRSYGVDLDDVFSSGSDRIYGDLTSLSGVDLQAVASEAIRRHPWEFARGIGHTLWEMLWAKGVYAPEPGPEEHLAVGGETKQAFVVVNGKRLPAPSEGQPIPASRVGPVLLTKARSREVWLSPSKHVFVFDDPADERRVAAFDRETERLAGRLPTRGSDQELVHRLNQTSHVFPSSLLWLLLGLLALAVRRPRRALVVLAPSLAALVVVVSTSLVAFAVGEYIVPMSPAFVLLATVGLVGDRRLQTHGG